MSSKTRPLYIAVDFDGTCVFEEFPNVGGTVPHCLDVLNRLVAAGHLIILHTAREGRYLNHATNWLIQHGIPLYGINQHPDYSTRSKVDADIFIDDKALGCPLMVNKDLSSRPFVDWVAVEKLLKQRRVL